MVQRLRAMRRTEKVSWTVLAGALSVGLLQIAEFLKNHTAWSEMFTPASVGEILLALAGVLGAIGAATMIAKSRNERHQDDARDRRIEERYRSGPPPAPPAV